MESRNPMWRVYAENRSKTQKLFGVKGLMQDRKQSADFKHIFQQTHAFECVFTLKQKKLTFFRIVK